MVRHNPLRPCTSQQSPSTNYRQAQSAPTKHDTIRASDLENWISGLELRMQIIPFGPIEARIAASHA